MLVQIVDEPELEADEDWEGSEGKEEEADGEEEELLESDEESDDEELLAEMEARLQASGAP